MSKEREPTQGRWYCAEDIDKMVRELDVAMNGSGAAQQARLCDIMGQLLKRISKADELERLRAENESLRKDAERLDWWFSPTPKHAFFVSTYLTGVEHHWAPVKWRAEIDAAMRESALQSGAGPKEQGV